jgi:hypothetical protein
VRKLVVALITLLGALRGSSKEYTPEIRELPRLTLRGGGCHRELLDDHGARICWGVIEKAGCISWVDTSGDTAKRNLFGSHCQPPGAKYGSEGNGSFFVEVDRGTFHLTCDDATYCERVFRRQAISACCSQAGMAPDAGWCDVPLDKGQECGVPLPKSVEDTCVRSDGGSSH